MIAVGQDSTEENSDWNGEEWKLLFASPPHTCIPNILLLSQADCAFLFSGLPLL